METPVFFGEWLKQRRKTLDLTQEELASRAGCSIFALRKIESGERRPSKQLAGLLASALEIPEEEQPIFVRVARGDSSLERLGIPGPGASPPSLSAFLTRQQTHETAGTDASPSLSTSLEAVSRRLPIPSFPLLGRDAELAALERLFKDPQCRLLTLTGMGGIGKTRLAIEFASRQQNMFPGGVHYVPLASISSIESIVPAVAAAFEYSFSGPGDPREQLLGFLSARMKRPALLVLDNLEHLIVQSSETAELVSEVLQRLRQLKVLTTSRERLNLQGEWMYELHGLPVPPAEFADRLEDYSGVALFMRVAKRMRTDFEIGESERADLIRICHLVEGIPLAIELAAAWVGMLTCGEIAREIEVNRDFLSTSMRDVPERHRSLRATFDHSWRLLSDQERDVLSRLSVFRGGFERSAAEKVAGASLPLLASLVSKSLVRRTEQGRFSLHEVIRQYARSHLDEDQSLLLETRDRHSEYYLHLAAEYEGKLKSASQQAAIRATTVEVDNMRIAWARGIERGKYESLSSAVRAFGWFFEVSGLLRVGIEQLELLVQAVSDQPRDLHMNRALGTALLHQGLLYFRKGQFVRAQGLYRDSIAVLRSIDERRMLADALIFSGTLMHLNGDYLEAKALIEEGLTYAREANDQWFVAYGIYNLGHVDSLMGEYQKGYDQMQEGMKIWRDVGDPHSISLGLNFLVNTQIALKRYEEAKTSMHESIALCEQTKNRWGMGTAYRFLGLATLAEGNFAEAQSHFHKSLEIFGEYFQGWDIALTLIYLGDATLMSGDLEGAEATYLKALRIAQEARSASLMLDALAGLAGFYVRSGRNERAWEVSSLVIRHPSAVQETRDRAIQIKQEAENYLGDEQMEPIRERISSQSLGDLVDTVIVN